MPVQTPAPKNRQQSKRHSRSIGKPDDDQPPTASATTKPTESAVVSSEFAWEDFLGQFESEIALLSLIRKCSHVLEDDTLTIFAGNKFNAGRLSGPKQLPKLNAALEALGQSKLKIVVKPEKAPPRDSHLAEIAVIMGGGEEVELHG